MSFFSHLHSEEITVWKFDKFTATKILREINFGEATSLKSAIFAVLEALDF